MPAPYYNLEQLDCIRAAFPRLNGAAGELMHLHSPKAAALKKRLWELSPIRAPYVEAHPRSVFTTVKNLCTAGAPYLAYNDSGKQGKEGRLATAVAYFMHHFFPTVPYRFDVAADLPMKKQAAVRLKCKYLHAPAYPDLFIASPAVINGVAHHGLYLELKATRADVFTLNGRLRSTEHLINQAYMLETLQRGGYVAEFAHGDDFHVFNLIHAYLVGEVNRG